MARILIVDDDPDIVDAARFFLEKAGHEVSCAYNRDEGMKKIGAFDPELLVLDVMMESPDDGLAMAQELRHRGWKRPILMLTSLSRAMGMDYGKDDEMVPVDEFIEKPVAPQKLVDTVSRLLSVRKEG